MFESTVAILAEAGFQREEFLQRNPLWFFISRTIGKVVAGVVLMAAAYGVASVRLLTVSKRVMPQQAE